MTRSPWRYPGGKSRLSKAILEHLPEELPGFTEPFTGGGGFTLPALGRVTEGSTVELNDADPRVFAWWEVMANSSDAEFERLMEMLVEYQPTVRNFLRTQKKSLKSGRAVERAFAAIATNRCSFSGILDAGPIGGLGQNSAYDVGCRYNPVAQVKMHRAVRELLSRFEVRVESKDFRDFLHSTDRESFLYADPPYVRAGPNLYPTAFDQHDHESLAEYVLENKITGWALSYDDHPWVRETYKDCQVIDIPVRYSVNTKVMTTELLVLP